MSALVLDPRAHSAAVKSAVSSALGSKWDAYYYDEVPGLVGEGEPPGMFAVVSVDPIPAYGRRMGGTTGVTRAIVSVRCAGRTVDEAQWVMWKAATALHEKRLTVDDRTTEPLVQQPGQSPRRDDKGRYSGLLVYTYSL